MKMDRMREWLENRGFDAELSYDSTMKAYRFKITRDGCTTVKFFKYPNGCDMVHVDRIQREFLEDAVRSFKSNTKDTSTEISKCPICGRHPDMTLTVTLDDLLDDNANKISCCGYTFTASSQAECLRKWNQHVENRNKLMNGFMFNTPLSNSIQKEVELMRNYMVNDAIKTAKAYAELDNLMHQRCAPQIKKVHFNKPVTCVIWTDGTKTLVRAQDGETYDPEKGMALAIAKKFLGNKGNYYNVFDKWLEEIERPDCKSALVPITVRKPNALGIRIVPCPTKKDAKNIKRKKGLVTEPIRFKEDTKSEAKDELRIKECSVGDEVIIRDGLKHGCTGAKNKCGILTLEPNTDGLLEGDQGVNVRINDTETWRVNPDCWVERIKKAPKQKKIRNKLFKRKGDLYYEKIRKSI